MVNAPFTIIHRHLMLTHIRQTSIGTGYDLSNSVFSPDGRNFQVEYAVKAVENGGTAIGIRCKDGVVLALEKLVTSKLLKKDANKRIATVDRNVGVVGHKQMMNMASLFQLLTLIHRSILASSPTADTS